MRRLAMLTFCLPLIVAGAIGAHWLSYLVVVPDATARETLLAATGHAYATWLPSLAAILGAIATVTLVALVTGRGTTLERLRLRPGAFLALPLVGWIVQEPAERASAGYSSPLHVWLEPVFWRGLLFQVPFALVAMLVATLVLRAARSVRLALRPGRASSARRTGPASPRQPTAGRFRTVAPRVRAGDALAFRGPPVPLPAGL